VYRRDYAVHHGRGLLERERELATLRDGVGRARAGEGTLLLIEAPAGVGKTVLCREACSLAERQQIMPLEARGSQLEQPFAFGVVRRLLDPVTSKEAGAPACSRAALVRRRGYLSPASGGRTVPISGSKRSTACTGWW
jgi:ATP/maltotriose-dependent transcriptional regulator MalT